jgi:hypothetical protein
VNWQHKLLTDYVAAMLIDLGYCYDPDSGYRKDRGTRKIISLVLRRLRKQNGNLQDVLTKLAMRKFRNSPEQHMLSRIVHEVLHLGPGEGKTRRQARTQSLGALDPAATDFQADPGLNFRHEKLTDELAEFLRPLAQRDKDIIYSLVIEEKTYRELSDEYCIPLSTLHGLIRGLKTVLAAHISRSRAKK